MAKWHVYKEKQIKDGIQDRDFKLHGELVSLARETVQNSTDNKLTGNECVNMKFTITKKENCSEYFGNNWLTHVTCNGNQIEKNSAERCTSGEIKVLLVEDYHTTGLMGDVNQYKENYVDDKYDDLTKNNVFLWFMRAIGVSRPTGGRGGSWGLGKLAIPLASQVKTFFCVTTREGGERYLVGQVHSNRHVYYNETYEGFLNYAKDDIIDQGNEFSWAPIDDKGEIDNFCKKFGVTRSEQEHGTSMVIPIPAAEITINNLMLSIIANYLRPIIDGELSLTFNDEGVETEVNKDNIFDQINSSSLYENSDIDMKRRCKENPAWTNAERLKELALLIQSYKSFCDGKPVLELPIQKPNLDTAPNSQIGSILPDRELEIVQKCKEAFNQGDFIHIQGKMPVQKDGTLFEGDFHLVIRKCANKESAEAHYYRDQISLRLQNRLRPCIDGVSSLMICDTIKNNYLGEMVRNAEGPAHLKWESSENRLESYKYGYTTIRFLDTLATSVANLLLSSETEKEEIWSNWFPKGKIHIDGPDIERNFKVVQTNTGFELSAREGAEFDLEKEYIIRVGYPGPQAVSPKKAPDKRRSDVSNRDEWKSDASLVVIDFNILAEDGSLCYDRIGFKILTEEAIKNFTITYSGQDPELKAQASITNKEV
jgi:hypothetical protein